MAQHATSPDSWIADRIPRPQQRFRELAQKVYAEGGALDLRTKELIAVACSSVGRCPHCTNGHLAKAREVGCSEEEIAEALAVAWADRLRRAGGVEPGGIRGAPAVGKLSAISYRLSVKTTRGRHPTRMPAPCTFCRS